VRPVVRLIPVDEAGAYAIVDGGCPAGLAPADGYPDEGDQTAAGMYLQYRAAVGDPAPFGHFVIAVDEGLDLPTAVGGIGFHGAPGDDASVEIGYAVAASWRRRGVATAALEEVVRFASAHRVRVLRARVDADNLASLRVLARGGFVEVPAPTGDASEQDEDVPLRHFERPLG
jgi:RimJ/RimL family protein N-acetyltransferase